MADLILAACNENVALPDWGLAFPGLQEEGLQVSWCWADDPMFVSTDFGGRWQGEGNKTCFPWIPAVAMACYWKLVDGYGTSGMQAIRAQAGVSRNALSRPAGTD